MNNSQEYTVKIISYPTNEDYENNVIKVMRDEEQVDRALMFTCHNTCRCKIFIPLCIENNEGGSSEPRRLHWIEKDKVLSITPSILIKGGCRAHYFITNNKVTY